jgi:Transcriptional Coactivator p15 (PC4)
VSTTTAQPANQTIFSFAEYRHEEVRASLTTFNGFELADLRVWATSDDGETPTRKRLTVQVDQLPQLLESVQALVQASKAA